MASVIQLTESDDYSSYERYVDRLVLPGMVLNLPRSDDFYSWIVGPGLICVPPVCVENEKDNTHLNKHILVRQVNNFMFLCICMIICALFWLLFIVFDFN